MRDELGRQLDALSASIAEMGAEVDGMLAAALTALADHDLVAADVVVATDANVDAAYERIQHGVLAVVALHSPVGHDLRRLIGMMHASLHLERMGDYARNLARDVRRSANESGDEQLTEQLVEMGGLARSIARTALEAFVRGDADLARTTAATDDDIDRLNVSVFQRLVALASEDDTRLHWAARMIGVGRVIERFADHGVDIAEQAVFVATGQAVDLASG